MYLSPGVAYLIDALGKLASAGSYIIMKYAHHLLEDKQKEGISNVKVYCSCTWLTGLGCIAIGAILNIIAVPYLDFVLLSTTVGLSIVFSNILAMKFLGEKIIWQYDLLSFVLVVGGCITIILVSKTEDEVLTPELIGNLLTSA